LTNANSRLGISFPGVWLSFSATHRTASTSRLWSLYTTYWLSFTCIHSAISICPSFENRNIFL
jgi:hypothetical protein